MDMASNVQRPAAPMAQSQFARLQQVRASCRWGPSEGLATLSEKTRESPSAFRSWNLSSPYAAIFGTNYLPRIPHNARTTMLLSFFGLTRAGGPTCGQARRWTLRLACSV